MTEVTARQEATARLTAPGTSIVGADQRIALSAGSTYVFGRKADCEVQLDGRQVSRHHAQVELDATGRVWLTDLGSTNGTLVDGTPLEPHHPTAVPPGATIVLGSAREGTPFQLEVDPDLVIDLHQSTTTVIPHQVLTIGRSADNSLQLRDPLVSRHHARAVPVEGGFLIENLNSRNGTFVDGVPAGPTVALEGSIVTVGRSTFRVQGSALVHWTQTSASLSARDLMVTIGEKKLLDDVSFDLPPSGLMAVIGPSGAGKTTLLRALTGTRPASSGTVHCDGRDLYTQYDDLRNRIGVVPQDDIVHPQLTVGQALTFAAELRFSDDLEASARTARVDEILEQLQLSQHRHTRVSRLSGGQRKRVSVAMELLTEPALLFLDEPTSGLDPGLDKAVMQLLRRLADGGRTVVVVTHNTASLGLCDKVLMMAPGGSVAYDGPPDGLLTHFDAADIADVFQAVSVDPDAYRRRNRPELPVPIADTSANTGGPRGRSSRRQFTTLLRRQFKLVTADRSYALSTVVLPAVLALMTLAIPGHHGLTGHGPRGQNLEARSLLVILMVGGAFMGSAMTIRELVSERAIFLRERAVGLSPVAYLGAKVVFATVLTAVQSAILVGLVLATVPGPGAGAVMPGWIELMVAVALTALAAACLALLLSSWVDNSEQVMPALVVMIMAQLVLCGGLIDVTGRAVLEQLSWLAPARWGYAAAAATSSLHRLVPLMPDDRLWRHTGHAWFIDVGALLVFSGVMLAATLLRLRRTRPTV